MAEPEAVLEALRARLAGDGCSLLVLFVSPAGDRERVCSAAHTVFPGVRTIGCTTAGEIGGGVGYLEDTLVAMALRDSHMAARVIDLEDLSAVRERRPAEALVRARLELAEERPGWTWEFAFLMVDGLSRREEPVLAALRQGLGGVPLFGGSAGDALAFRRASVLSGGRFRENAAVLALLRSRCPVKVFRFDHLRPSAAKMVVTDAVPSQRLVRSINAAPAAREYARLIGHVPGDLSPSVFAAHPLVVRVGGHHYVRSIQKVEPNGDLTFFSAIDEGLVLTLAEPTDIVAHLQRSLEDLATHARPDAIIGCDCFLRRLEVEQTQATAAMSGILAAHHVVGFNTYGEQYGSVHVNQTFTGVAVYPPEGPGT